MTPIPSPARGRGTQSPTISAWCTRSTTLAALVALSMILAACTAGSNPSADGTSAPSASVVAPASPTATPEPTPIPATPSPEPTPIAEWTGLVWSDPVTPPFTIHLTDVVPWGDGYVAGGTASVVDAAGAAAVFLTSSDGLHWAVAGQISSGYPSWLTVIDLTALGDELYGFSHPMADALPDQPLIWRSADGADWSAVDPIGWEEAWTKVRGGALPATWDQTQYPVATGLVDVASGPSGIVAIGNSIADDGLIPIVLHSSDGQNWSEVSLPAGTVSPLLNEVVGYDGGFVLVGATDVGADLSTAMPAAWTSVDGLTWARATVADDDGTSGGELGVVHAGSDGMVACFGPREMLAGGRRFTAPWFSTDGRSWRGPSQADPDQSCAPMDSDGVRMVAVPITYHPDTGQWSPIETAWVSTDAWTWIELAMSSPMADQMEAFWVVPEGVIYAGVQSFWFGAAQVAE